MTRVKRERRKTLYLCANVIIVRKIRLSAIPGILSDAVSANNKSRCKLYEIQKHSISKRRDNLPFPLIGLYADMKFNLSRFRY